MLPSQIRRQLPRKKESVANLVGLWSSTPETPDFPSEMDDLSQDMPPCTIAELFRLLSKMKRNYNEENAYLVLDIDEIIAQLSKPSLLKKLCQNAGALTMLRYFSETLIRIFEKISSVPSTHPDYDKDQKLLENFQAVFRSTFEESSSHSWSTQAQATKAYLKEIFSPFINSSPVTTSVARLTKP